MITINGVRWRVRLVPPSHPFLATRRNTFALGCCDNLAKTIYISNALSRAMIKKVLCHEIVHAAMFSYGVDLSYHEEELVADLISTYGDEIIATTNLIYDRIKIK
jgi:hypothetical protein